MKQCTGGLLLFLYWWMTHFRCVLLLVRILAHDLNHTLNTSKVSGRNTHMETYSSPYSAAACTTHDNRGHLYHEVIQRSKSPFISIYHTAEQEHYTTELYCSHVRILRVNIAWNKISITNHAQLVSRYTFQCLQHY